MKKLFFLLVAVIAISTTACKKDYTCTAVDSQGNEVTLNCENCSKKNADDYEQSILDAGYTSADCAKK